ncbi:MAG TPA: type II toxin-antitoxin system RelE/ParE family toxin [Gammaproteobacteria bacterium]|jgi:phage-related protein|nr:type II toxin-antitoxin system RelE/ParE family toxin [Gammaproteobacteria bacterium]MBT3718777.1 type II toxin-antitoxin system RelE/ParE family toxin [Gammaproteobacteria bacterium]MBT3892012.1 type II toxin-antitoxin system RelE/ParE family toxin [Gammaproteobacteria bacterium]MBT4300463.1 type II toxin-antitoxin system RelE/ParE family toxin [Gammaproteobacteria bacterium]MBT4547933.1 type II toxin-antitoxin system RelE/ParE family toxin [Gammaproteobacteria bacterium]
MNSEKPIYWVGSSYSDLLEFPLEAKQDAGYQLHRIQNGLEPENWKPFQAVGTGVKEIRISDDGNAFRIMYVAKFHEKIYVLHSFQKKDQKTRPQDINLAKKRYDAISKGEL